VAVLFARPFPPEQETDPANPALAGQQKPYRWGTYLGTLLFTSALVMCIDVLIYILESKALWAVISFAGAVLSLAGSIDLFRRNWRGVFLFTAWLVSGILTGATLWFSLIYFQRRKPLMQRAD